MKNKNLLKIVS